MAPAPRLHALDALRGLAVFLMMEQHIGIWLTGAARKNPLYLAFNGLGGLAAPLFIALAGIGATLFVTRRPAGADAILVRRGVTLIAFGYALNWLTPSWLGPWSWFVLHLIGFGLLTTPIWRHLPARTLLALAAVTVIASAALHIWLMTPRYLGEDRMGSADRPGGVLRLALVEGHFPVFPWLSMFLVGVVAGRWIDAGRTVAVANLRRLAAVTFGTAALIAGIGQLARAKLLPLDAIMPRAAWLRVFSTPLGFYPALPAIILTLMTGVLLLLLLVQYRPAAARIGGTPRSWPVTLGRASLTLLIVHVVLFNEGADVLGLRYQLPVQWTVAIIAAWTVLCVALTGAWQRRRYRYGAEWLLRRIAG